MISVHFNTLDCELWWWWTPIHNPCQIQLPQLNPQKLWIRELRNHFQVRYDPNRWVQFEDIYTESEGKLLTISAPKRDSLIEWIPWTRSSDTPRYESTVWHRQKEVVAELLPHSGHGSAPQQPFREPIPPCLFPHPQKYLPKWSESNHFINPVLKTGSHTCAVVSGWVRLPPIVLLKGLWHQALHTQVPWHFAFLCFSFPSLSLFRP